MGRAVRRWWFIPAGFLVGLAIAAAIGTTWALIVAVCYVGLNLFGTVLLIHEMRDQERPLRWRRVVEVAFVVQVPIGVLILFGGGT